MIKQIKNATVYAPDCLGSIDVIIAGGKICQIGKDLEFGENIEVEIIDGTGKYLVPGFIDSHEHIMGGGGEGGFSTRTPEAVLTDLSVYGITTVVGCIGTDGIGRDMTALLAKAKGLEEEGISTFVYTGSYQVPVHTLTGSLMKDIMMIDKVIGVGEIAISDHRSSQPTFEEFIRIAADSRVGGMLSGKAGILNIHLGDSPRCIDLIERTVEETEIPRSQFLPTHINRNAMLFERCLSYAKNGGFVDFTGNEEIDYWETICDEVRVCTGIKRMLAEGVSSDQFTISSDGQGSLPIFNEKQEFIGIGIGKGSCLLKEVRECVQKEKIPLEIAIKAITSNPAAILKLKGKGRIEKGYDADLCLLNAEDLTINMVVAKGNIMVKEGKPTVYGTFETTNKEK